MLALEIRKDVTPIRFNEFNQSKNVISGYNQLMRERRKKVEKLIDRLKKLFAKL